MSFIDATAPVLTASAKDFEELGGDRFCFFYGSNEMSGGVATERVSDGDDAELASMFLEAPYEFSNATQLERYTALVSRPSCELRVHERQTELRELAATEIGATLAAECLMMAYRFAAPSALLGDGDGYSTTLEARLFDAHSYEPHGAVQILWHRGGARVGVLAARRIEPENKSEAL